MKVKIYNSQTKEEFQFDLALAIKSNEKCTVGRSPTSSLILESFQVSYTHGVFSYQEGNYYFTDTGSSNGSWLNHNVALKNQTYLLKAGDVLQLGEFVLTLQPVVEHYEDATLEQVPVAVDADPAVISAIASQVVHKAEEISAAATQNNASAETLFPTKDVPQQKVTPTSVPEELCNAGELEQKVSDNTQSYTQPSQVNQQIKPVSPMTFSQKFYQAHKLDITKEFEQALEANSLEKIKDLLDKILELGEGK